MTLTDAAMKRVREIAAAATYDLHDRSVADLHDVENAIRAALADPVLRGWRPIESAPRGKIVLVYYKNQLGNGRTMRARYYEPETLESETTDSGWADEGWYEESEAYEYLMPIDCEPTHWMPLPPPPEGK